MPKQIHLVIRVTGANNRHVISAHSSRKEANKKAKTLGSTPETYCHFAIEHVVKTFAIDE